MKKRAVQKRGKKIRDFFKRQGFENTKRNREVLRYADNFVEKYRGALEALEKM